MSEDKTKAALADGKVTVDELRDVALEAKNNGGVVDNKEFSNIKVLRSKALADAKSETEKADINGIMVDVLSAKQLMELLKNDTLKWMTVIIFMFFFTALSLIKGLFMP